nr:ATP-binding cassette domain-containing protein [Dubosiella newyorkensis]
MILWNQSFKGKLAKKQEQIMSSKRSWISSIQQFYQNFPVIKEYRLEKMEKQELDRSAQEWADSEYRTNLMVDLLGSVNLEVGLIMFLGVYFICGLTARYTNVSIGILMAISQASNMITNPIINFATLKNKMNASEPIVRSFYQRKESKISEKTLVSTIDTIKIDLDELKDKNKVLLKNIHLEFKRGKKYMITGPSGCGKTTLLKTIKGLYSTNAVTINGLTHAEFF